MMLRYSKGVHFLTLWRYILAVGRPLAKAKILDEPTVCRHKLADAQMSQMSQSEILKMICNYSNVKSGVSRGENTK